MTLKFEKVSQPPKTLCLINCDRNLHCLQWRRFMDFEKERTTIWNAHGQVDGCGFPARPQTHGHFSQASIARYSNFDQKRNPVTVPVLALNFRCWSTPVRLGLASFSENETRQPQKKPGRRLLAVRGTKRFLGWSKVHFPQGTKQIQSKKTLFTSPLWKKWSFQWVLGHPRRPRGR